MKNKLLKLILIVETMVLILGICIVSINVFVNKKKEICKELSPNGNYVLVIHRIGKPDWPFGADHLQVSLFEKNNSSSYRASFQADVSNDGMEASYEVTWRDDSVQIALIGSEQPTAYYLLPFESYN